MLKGLEPRLPEDGRLRFGQQVPTQKGGTRPERLRTWRLTSPNEVFVRTAASLFGGVPERWNDQWEVVTDRASLPVVLVVDHCLTQYWELWSGGGCQRRCDGVADVRTGEACQCPEDLNERRKLGARGRACRPVTRLTVLLPGVSTGQWRLDTGGELAAREIAAKVQLLRNSPTPRHFADADLRVEHREQRSPEGTKRFAVPVLDLKVTLEELLTGGRAAGELPSPTGEGASSAPAAVAAPASPPALGDAGASRSHRGDVGASPVPVAAVTAPEAPAAGAEPSQPTWPAVTPPPAGQVAHPASVQAVCEAHGLTVEDVVELLNDRWPERAYTAEKVLALDGPEQLTWLDGFLAQYEPKATS